MSTSDSIDVCIIEDDPDQRRFIARVLGDEGLSISEAECWESGHNIVTQEHPKVTLCDYDLPGGKGIDLCNRLRQNPDLLSCYFIVMSASAECDVPANVLNAGANDYLAKPINREELTARVRVGMRMSTMHEQLRRAAITDGLTGLYNHDHFNRLLEAEVGRSRRYGHPLALIMMDLDYFKAINDTFGHLAGNAALEEVARVLRSCVRDVDSVARFGGEEFVVVLPRAVTPDAVQVAERIRAGLAQSVRIEPLQNHVVTASFGIADSDDPRVKCAADLVDTADRALYVAKHRGRNQVVLGSDLRDGAEFAATIQADEVEALRRRLTALSVRAKDTYIQSVAALLQALDEKDPLTARHAVNVGFYAQRIAQRMGCSRAIVKA
ncbi:MAG: diguanylate cyclase, partial [Phycisphaerae bacterium]